MAWNEPGGNNKGSWNNQGGEPPDLEELLKNFQKRFGGLFGGDDEGKGGSGGGMGIGLLLLVGVLIWAALGIYIVDPAERVVVLRFGKYHSTEGPGPHWRMPLVDTKIRVNVDERRTHRREGVMLTQDENIVNVDFSVQYKISDVKDYVLNVRGPDVTLKQAVETSLRQVVGRSNFDLVISEGRVQVAQQTKEQLQLLLDRYRTGLVVTEAIMQRAKQPEQVQEAFDDVTRAREDQIRLINEAEAYSNQVVPVARGEAQRKIAEANGYKDSVIANAMGEANRFSQLLTEYKKAPQVTRERLYLESVESVLSNTSKIMIDVEGGNNLLYLPLDKMFKEQLPVMGGGNVNFGTDKTLSQPTQSQSLPSQIYNRERNRSRERGL